jgi:hypothetical protein
MAGPHLILEVRLGPRRGKKAALAPGDVLTVGRSDVADLVVPEDQQLSPMHFEIRWDGAEARLKDLGSAGGTKLNGEPCTERPVRHGGWIRAGQLDLTVRVEGHTAAPVDEDDDDDDDEGEGEGEDESPPPFPAEPPPVTPEEELDAERRAAQRDDLRRIDAALAVERRMERRARALREQAAERALPILQATAEAGALHAVLDAARTPRILEVLREAVEEHQSLYEGTQGVALEDAAPYLVRLKAESRLLAQLVREGWARRWGIFTEGPVPHRELRRHLRRFLMVEGDGGEPLYFRFYDPGALRDFWPSCSRRQLAELIGPLRAFLVEGERGEVLRLTASGKVEPLDGGATAPEPRP